MTFAHAVVFPPVSRPWLLCAAAAVGAAYVGVLPGTGLIFAGLIVLGLAATHRPWAAMLVALVAVAASFSVSQLEPLPPGRIDLDGIMAGDVVKGRYGPYALIETRAGPVLANLPPQADASRGDTVQIEGTVVGEPGEVGGEPHRGTIDVRVFHRRGGPGSPILAIGNSIRDRVIDRLIPLHEGRALLAGFLVGETSGVEEVDQSAMRRAGLSHFTAVSGSNVALFLVMLYVAAGPLGIGPRRRAILGLVGLPFFAAATRFEPSVVRASTMAGLVLGGRLIGLVMETWQVFSAAVVGLLLLDPGLVRNPGFQLSVAATAGVIVGARWPSSQRRLARALMVSVGAQLAVAPLLLVHFGQLPLLSPLANLVAAPLVALSTILGVIGVLGPNAIVDLGAWLADVVLGIARIASGWPQLGWLGLGAMLAAGVLFLSWPRMRGALSLLASVVVAISVLGPMRGLPDPGVVVLDVGQGDAILISGGGGRLALVDGGPDPVALLENLHQYGVRRLDLVVLTHAHADHALGLGVLAGRIPIGEIWARLDAHQTSVSTELSELWSRGGIAVVAPVKGDRFRLGQLTIVVEGPVRKYASSNDESIVLSVTGGSRSMLLAGDIEGYAQADLGYLRSEVLKVPHHGGATSSSEWLEGVDADLAVISVGDNDFGHPVGWVISTLENSGATVARTDVSGDVVVPLG